MKFSAWSRNIRKSKRRCRHVSWRGRFCCDRCHHFRTSIAIVWPCRDGDFSVSLPLDWSGVDGRITELIFRERVLGYDWLERHFCRAPQRGQSLRDGLFSKTLAMDCNIEQDPAIGGQYS